MGEPGQHRYFFPWTLTPKGSIYAKKGDKLVYLDNVSGKWQESSMPRPDSLSGADENGLIFELPDHRTFEWVAVGPVGVCATKISVEILPP